MKFDGTAFSQEVVTLTKAYIEKSMAPILARLEAAEKRVAELEALPKAATAEEVAALIPAPKDGEGVDPAAIKAMVDEAVAALPPAKDGIDGAPGEKGDAGKNGVDGKDGRDGADGAPGEKGIDGTAGRDGIDGAPGANGEKGLDGVPGLDGKDGISLAGVLKDHEGCLVFTLSDGTMTKITHVDGKDGAPGRDADPEVMREAVRDEVQKQTLAPMATAYKGVWTLGSYKPGDMVTWAGSMWLAKADTEAKPEASDAWQLIVKRGRDGKDGRDLSPPPPKPVKL